jgi:hypothetical protein
MDKIEHIEYSINKAENLQSKLLDDLSINYDGMSSKKIRHFLNNLLEIDNASYLEIGVNKGSTFISALYKNSPIYTCAIDNWSEFGNNEIFFLNNCSKYNIQLNNFINENSFKLNINKIEHLINIYFYDGNHDELSQYNAIKYYYDKLDDEFIFIVDDYRNSWVKTGTQNVIKDLNLIKIYEKELISINNDKNNWWNGLYISILKK